VLHQTPKGFAFASEGRARLVLRRCAQHLRDAGTASRFFGTVSTGDDSGGSVWPSPPGHRNALPCGAAAHARAAALVGPAVFPAAREPHSRAIFPSGETVAGASEGAVAHAIAAPTCPWACFFRADWIPAQRGAPALAGNWAESSRLHTHISGPPRSMKRNWARLASEIDSRRSTTKGPFERDRVLARPDELAPALTSPLGPRSIRTFGVAWPQRRRAEGCPLSGVVRRTFRRAIKLCRYTRRATLDALGIPAAIAAN